MRSSLLSQTAALLADSPLLGRGKALFAENQRNWNLSLSKLQKLQAGLWLILHDYHEGIFPPTFPDQQKAYLAEKDYRFFIPGLSAAEVSRCNMAKPFWFNRFGRQYLRDFVRLDISLEKLGVRPPAQILELGCGSGWMAEFLAATGFQTCGTSISDDDIADARTRIQSLEAKRIPASLRYVASPMESVHEAVPQDSFDAALVYEALHHAFDWRAALRSVHRCLKPGGWFLICNEPNVLHTCISYRIARLSNTHEIGFHRGELIAELRKTGFRRIISAGARLHCWFRPHWIFAQK